MAHLRQQIRERVATTVTGLTTTGSRVYQSRVYPLADANLPGLLVYSTSESSEPDVMTSGNRTLFRELEIVIEGYAKATSNLDDTLDTITDEIETAMAADRTVNSLARDATLASTAITLIGEGEKPVGVVTLTYRVTYRNAMNAPDTAA